MPRRASSRRRSTLSDMMSIKVPMKVWALFMPAMAAAGYVYYNGIISPMPPIIATGKWRVDYGGKAQELGKMLGQKIKILYQVDEGLQSAQSAHSILKDTGIISVVEKQHALFSTTDNSSNAKVLYVESGRGSMQFTVLDTTGTTIKQALASRGIPKPEKLTLKDLTDKRAALDELKDYLPDIRLVVVYGSLYHLYGNFDEKLIVEDHSELDASSCKFRDVPGNRVNDELVKRIPSQEAAIAENTPNGVSYDDLLKLVPEFVKNQICEILIIRNVKDQNNNPRKVSWGSLEAGNFVDLGSGKVALIDPKSGTVVDKQSAEFDFDNDSISDIATKVRQVQNRTYVFE